jgi:hypothetical protein
MQYVVLSSHSPNLCHRWFQDQQYCSRQHKLRHFPINGMLKWGGWLQITCFDKEEKIYLY